MGRKFTISFVCAATVAASGLIVAPQAGADNQSYLNVVNGFASSEDGENGLLKVGKGACSLLRPNNALMFGRHPNLVAQMVWEQNPGLERREAALMVNAAIDNLCPGVNPFGYAAV